MQHDALERLDLRRMLLDPQLLATVEPDLELASELIALGSVMPAETRETARTSLGISDVTREGRLILGGSVAIAPGGRRGVAITRQLDTATAVVSWIP